MESYREKKARRKQSEARHMRVIVVAGLTGAVLGAAFAERAGAGFALGSLAFLPAAFINQGIDWADEQIRIYKEAHSPNRDDRDGFIPRPSVHENMADRFIDDVLDIF